jgi:uracil phosphoribosyltransferase
MAVILVDHPLAQHLLNSLRDCNTEPLRFRQLARQLSTILILEATRDLPLTQRPITTPLTDMTANFLGHGLAVVPILRAGLAMLESALELFPDVAVGYVGLERDHATAEASSYYCKLPHLVGRTTLLVDPMLATGGSACQAIDLLKDNGAKTVVFVSVIAAPEGIARVEASHPDTKIFTASIDERLNDVKYIVPGLGDFGDRMYGTM